MLDKTSCFERKVFKILAKYLNSWTHEKDKDGLNIVKYMIVETWRHYFYNFAVFLLISCCVLYHLLTWQVCNAIFVVDFILFTWEHCFLYPSLVEVWLQLCHTGGGALGREISNTLYNKTRLSYTVNSCYSKPGYSKLLPLINT